MIPSHVNSEPPPAPQPPPSHTPPGNSSASLAAARHRGGVKERNLRLDYNSKMEAKLTHAIDFASLDEVQEEQAGLLLLQLQESKGDNQHELLGKAGEFLKSLPEGVQSLIEQHADSLAADPDMQAKQREIDDLHARILQLEANQNGTSPPAQPQPASTPASTSTQPLHPAQPHPHVSQPSQQPHHGGIQQQLSKLEALEKEQAALALDGDMHSPSAQLRAKEIEMRMAMLMENILSMMKMVADINKRANQIATSAI
jgi:hypothetical protein